MVSIALFGISASFSCLNSSMTGSGTTIASVTGATYEADGACSGTTTSDSGAAGAGTTTGSYTTSGS